MKKIILLLLVAIFIFGCSSCGEGEYIKPDSPDEVQTYFTIIYKATNYNIIYDNDTGVIYWMSKGVYNIGNLFPLYNADGSLKIYTSRPEHGV